MHWNFGAGLVHKRTKFWLSNLSDGTETYTGWWGFNDDSGGTSGVDAVAIRYTHTENAGKFLCYTRSNSVESTADSGVTVAATTAYTFDFVVNPAGSSANYFINGTQVCTITTNIPTGIARATAILPGIIQKSVGAAQRDINFEYVSVLAALTTAR